MQFALIPLILLFFAETALASGRFIPKPYKDGSLHRLTQYPDSVKLETATFAGGCFWGVESAFRQVKGVASTRSGFSGGKVKNPSYKQVTRGNTGHAEAVEVVYNPKEVSYEELLEVFFKVHDPTQLNRQGPDIGTQYRTAIFTHSPAQAKAAKKKIAEMTGAKKYSRPIVTEVTKFAAFYPAEDYHQQYFEKMAKRHYGMQ